MMGYAKKGTVSGVRVTSQAVELYREARVLWPKRVACIESPQQCDHAHCDRFHALEDELLGELNIKPWEDLFDDDEGRAKALRDALEAAL